MRPPSDAPVAAPAWTIRAEDPLDLDQIHELHRASFPGADEADLVDAIRTGPTFIPELSLVAVTDDGSVLGHVLLSRVGLDLAEITTLSDLQAGLKHCIGRTLREATGATR